MWHFINDCPERTKPPEGYVCKICDTPGHLVRDCPTRFALGDTGGKKPKEGYICRACGSDAHYIDDCPASSQRPPRDDHRGRGRRGPPKEIAPDECWFCLSNPNLAKHLIVAIGSECYVTLPKGQIIPTQSAADHVAVPGGGHVLIVPITHYPTFSTIPGDLAAPIIEETEKHKAALRAMYAKYGAAIVVFEVGRLSAKGGHAHVQAVPVPLKLKDKVEEAFRAEGRMMGIDFEEDPDSALESCAGGRGSYFRVDLPDGRKLVHLMKDHVPFSIQFGRQVLVSLLNMPERLDWKACTLADDEDRADAQAFKAAFAPFDPTL
ncbi:CwfJ C-terminus 1-domain-containing protein-like protein [Mycena crocata]|nr:CwfJ C-terminus 1-domain-containing protein-like protein [Mycena crocata]